MKILLYTLFIALILTEAGLGILLLDIIRSMIIDVGK